MAERLTVEEASEAYAGAMRNVQPAGPGICAICKTFIEAGWRVCYPCNNEPDALDAVVPITYSEHYGQMHDALRGYKDGVPQVRQYANLRLNGILWRFAAAHESCVVRATGVDAFDVVTTVPSTDPARDDARGHLRKIIEACDPLAGRYQRLLLSTGEVPVGQRGYDERRFAAHWDLVGANVLLIDDTWAGGGHAQSAAGVLKTAGASAVGLIVIGRHVRPEWKIDGVPSSELLQGLPSVFDWDTCCVHR